MIRKLGASSLAAVDTYPVLHSQGHGIACVTKKVYSILVQQVPEVLAIDLSKTARKVVREVEP